MKVLPFLLALAGGLVGAQFGDFNPFAMMADPIQVLHRGEVQRELKLSKEQSKAIDALYKQAFTANSGSADDMGAGMDQFNNFKEASNKAMDVLDEDQKTRAKQIRYQMLGPVSITEPEVQKALGMTEDQIAASKKIREDAMGELLDMMKGGGGNPRSVSHRVDELSKKEAADLLAVLNAAQQAKFTELLGAPFKNARPKGFNPY